MFKLWVPEEGGLSVPRSSPIFLHAICNAIFQYSPARQKCCLDAWYVHLVLLGTFN